MSRRKPPGKTENVLFVCLGNICRSPAAEAILQDLARARGVDGHLRVESAGILSIQAGKLPDPRMRRAAARRGYELTSRARQVRSAELPEQTVVIVMDQSVMSDLIYLAGHECPNARLMSDFLPGRSPVDVPDPFSGPDEDFEVVLDLLEAACPCLLEHLFPGTGS